MNELQEIKATIARIEKGIAYLDEVGHSDEQTDKALSLFHELSKTLAGQTVAFELKHGKLNIQQNKTVDLVL